MCQLIAFSWLIGLVVIGSCAATDELRSHNDTSTTTTSRLRGLRRRGKNAEPRIVGGVLAKNGEFPFNVLGAQCGGSMVTDDVLVSAAHCKGVLGTVLVGSNSRAGGGDSQERRVVREVVHPKWNPREFEWDIMVAKLNRPVTGNKLKPVTMVKGKTLPRPNSNLVALGFGRLSDGGPVSNNLRKVNLKSVKYSKCNKQYREAGGIDRMSMTCAGVPNGGKDTCGGDSGGALLLNGELVGVTSWGFGCALKRYSGVYARVPTAMTWLENQICRMTDSNPGFCDGKRRRRRRLGANSTHLATAALWHNDSIAR